MAKSVRAELDFSKVNIEDAIIAHDSVKTLREVLKGVPVTGFEQRADRLVSALNRFTRGVEIDFARGGVKVEFGNKSLLVPKTEHDRVLEQLKRYSGE